MTNKLEIVYYLNLFDINDGYSTSYQVWRKIWVTIGYKDKNKYVHITLIFSSSHSF